MCDRLEPVDVGVIFGVSANGDPTGTWTIAPFDADAANANWADFGSTGFSDTFVVTSVNMNGSNSGTPPAFVRPDLHVFKIADLLNGTVLPTVFTGQTSGAGLVGGTLSPNVTRDAGVHDVFPRPGVERRTGAVAGQPDLA